MTLVEIRNLLLSTDGKIFSVKFIKRTTGEIREMTCRTGVTAHLAENPTKPGIDFRENRLVSVFDMQKQAYRSIPIENVLEVKINGEWIKCQELICSGDGQQSCGKVTTGKVWADGSPCCDDCASRSEADARHYAEGKS